MKIKHEVVISVVVAFACASAWAQEPAPSVVVSDVGASGSNVVTRTTVDPGTVEMDDVVVTPDAGLIHTELGTVAVSGDELRGVPQSAFADISAGLSTFPGVVRASRFDSLLYIRGGRPYQTLHVLNGVLLLNPYKWFGGLMVYNQELVDGVELHAGGFGAQYPEAMAGVIEVDYIQGNDEEMDGQVTLGAETSAQITGPMWAGTGVFSYRRTFYDMFMTENSSGDTIQFPYFEDWYLSTSQWLTPHYLLHIWFLHSREGMEFVFDDEGDDDWVKEGDSFGYQAESDHIAVDLSRHYGEAHVSRLILSFTRDEWTDMAADMFLAEWEGHIRTDYYMLLADTRHELGRHTLTVGGGLIYTHVREYDFKGTWVGANVEDEVAVTIDFDENLDELRDSDAERDAIRYAYLTDEIIQP